VDTEQILGQCASGLAFLAALFFGSPRTER
jgi:hypothetical protein